MPFIQYVGKVFSLNDPKLEYIFIAQLATGGLLGPWQGKGVSCPTIIVYQTYVDDSMDTDVVSMSLCGSNTQFQYPSRLYGVLR